MKKLILIVIPLFILSCTPDKNETLNEINEIPVEIIKVKTETYSPKLYFVGTLYANRRASLAPGMPGKVERIYVEVGDSVKKGQLLVRFTQEMLIQAEAQLSAAESDYKRAKNLLERDAISLQTYERAEASYLTAKAQRDFSARAALIYAPFSGIITDKMIEEGELFSPTPQMAGGELVSPGVLLLINIDTIKIEIDISENDMLHIRKGQEALLTLDLYPDSIWHGSVSSVGISLNTMTRTIPAAVSFPNENLVLKPGMFGTVFIELDQRRSIWIPEISLVRKPGTDEHFIYVVNENSIVERRSIFLGRSSDDRFEVVTGLKDGEIIVSTGARTLSDGDKVKIVDGDE